MSFDPMKLSAQIHRARSQRGISQQALADRLALAQGSLSRYENGFVPPLDVLCAIAAELDKSLTFFLEGQSDLVVVRDSSLYQMIRRLEDKTDSVRDLVRLLELVDGRRGG